VHNVVYDENWEEYMALEATHHGEGKVASQFGVPSTCPTADNAYGGKEWLAVAQGKQRVEESVGC
jgi:hypothetical protein